MTALRHPLWEQRLHDLISEHIERPHKYGEWDCMLMPAAVIKAVTGQDLGRGHKGKYRSAASASRYLRQIGFNHPSEMLDSLFEEKPIGFAQRGDLVLCRTPSGDNPGVCYGDFALVVGEIGEQGEPGAKEGLVRCGRENWLKAWALGDHHSGPLKLPRKRKPRAKAK